MSFQRKLVATSLAAAFAAGGMYTFQVYRPVQFVPSDQITHSDIVSESYQKSRTVRELVNPRQHTTVADSHRYSFRLPARLRDVSDEALLASLVRGYFGGLVFGPERCALKAYGRPAVYFEEAAHTKAIWSAAELSNTKLPPLNSVLFGGFQVIEKYVNDISKEYAAPTESCIHFGFGSNRGQFTGAHRFAINRSTADPAAVEVIYESVACNPTVDLPLNPIIREFHFIYARLLFSDTLFGLRKGLDNSRTIFGPSHVAGADTADGLDADS